MAAGDGRAPAARDEVVAFYRDKAAGEWQAWERSWYYRLTFTITLRHILSGIRPEHVQSPTSTPG